MKYFDEARKSQLDEIITSITDAIAESYQFQMPSEQRMPLIEEKNNLIKQRDALPIRHEVGDGVHTANNGDCYPYKVMSVSKSGKTIEVARMGHRAAEQGLPMGHQEWEVYDLPDMETAETETYTLRKNGKWIRQGASIKDYWMAIHPGAIYRYNWEV